MNVKYACLLCKPLTTNTSRGHVVVVPQVAHWYDGTRPKKTIQWVLCPAKTTHINNYEHK